MAGTIINLKPDSLRMLSLNIFHAPLVNMDKDHMVQLL